jgi:NAD(P)-dependent dehydrogenase (short-subunit alcohol dehydrogenase family)
MEYAMRLFALRAARSRVSCNVVVPGVTKTDAWARLAESRGVPADQLVDGMASRLAPLGATTPEQLGKAIAFLCSPAGRAITGVSLPVDNGVHLRC